MSPRVEELGATPAERVELAIALMHAMSDGLVYTEGSVIKMVNTAMCEITGLPREALLGQGPPFVFWRPTDHERNLELVGEAIRDGGKQGVEVTLRRASGEEFAAEVNVYPVFRADGSRRGFVTILRDVSQRQADLSALAASEARFRSTVDNSPIGVAVVSLAGEPLELNRALCTMLRRTEERVRADWDHLVHPDDRHSDRDERRDLVSGALSSYHIDRRYLRPDGSVVHADLHVALVRDEHGAPSHLIAQLVDVTERRQLERQLEEQAVTDALTGLANRRAWEPHLARLADASTVPVAVGILDIDHFKVFNDAYGHPAGDDLLRATSAVWQGIVQRYPGSLLARIGGEEFAVVLVDVSIEQAKGIAEELIAGVTHDQRASAGLTELTHADTAQSVMARADAALYTAKRAGRGRVVTLADA